MIEKVLGIILNTVFIKNDSNKNVALLINADISKEAREKLIAEYVRDISTQEKLRLVMFTLVIIFGIVYKLL